MVSTLEGLAGVVAAKCPENVEVYLTETEGLVRIWLPKAEFTQTDEKTEVVSIRVNRKT